MKIKKLTAYLLMSGMILGTMSSDLYTIKAQAVETIEETEVKTPENEIMLDATGRKNGRGAYICADPGCLRLARKNKGLERSLKTAIPQEVYESLEKEMSTLA